MSLSQNHIPQAAEDRLRSRLFTSDLTVDELVVLEEMNVEPLGLVLGSSIYHVGVQSSRFNKSQEMDVLSHAMYEARSLAIGRMETEAADLSADGIVGVDFAINRYEWGEDLLEFLVIGTGVRARDTSLNLKPRHGKPFSSDLSAQDLWKLVRAGYRPVRLSMGSCVYHVATQSIGQFFRSFGRNTEMENFTQATYEAREIAMSRMEAEAEAAGGDGLVAVQINERSWGWGSHIIEFFALGTAVVREGTEDPPTPQVILSLDKS